VALVFLVMLLFLQNFRYTVIPTMVVPVALLGTFAVLLALGFSINVLTMFGMVLVIGIVVDDAIVVVENVERIMSRGACRRARPRARPWGRSRAPSSASPWC
jgi:multidrug efflux pump